MLQIVNRQLKITFILTCLLLAFFYKGPGILQAQAIPIKDPDPLRFENEISSFVAWDKKNSFPEHAVLFVGSSSIRFWHTHDAFPDYPLINRGFGGAHISDILYYYDWIVKKYQPQLIFFYAGDNDIADGKRAERVYGDFFQFTARVSEDFPDTKVVFILIKPSLARWSYWDEMQRANLLIEQYAKDNPNLFCADVASPLIAPDGLPDLKFFVSDSLHLNRDGYALWETIIAPFLAEQYLRTDKQ